MGQSSKTSYSKPLTVYYDRYCWTSVTHLVANARLTYQMIPNSAANNNKHLFLHSGRYRSTVIWLSLSGSQLGGFVSECRWNWACFRLWIGFRAPPRAFVLGSQNPGTVNAQGILFSHWVTDVQKLCGTAQALLRVLLASFLLASYWANPVRAKATLFEREVDFTKMRLEAEVKIHSKIIHTIKTIIVMIHS